MLGIKETFLKLTHKSFVTFTPSKGSEYSGWGGCFYEVCGRVVHIHLAISGLTQGSGNMVYTVPVELRPSYSASMEYIGGAGSTTNTCTAFFDTTTGTITVYPQGTYCVAEITYMF